MFSPRIVDALLREELGGECAPDLGQQVLLRLEQERRSRAARMRLWSAAAAAAAGLVLCVGLWFAGGYPGPRASGGFSVANGSEVRRGATLVTREQPAQLDLGQYAQVTVSPDSRVTIAGKPDAEEIVLERGTVLARVDRGAGREFMVRTEAGTVTVHGTQFEVRILDSQGDETMVGKRMLVRVIAGVVVAATAFQTQTLTAGDQATLPDGGTVTGVITEKGEGWIRVRPESGDSERYTAKWIGATPADGGGLDKDMVRLIAQTPVGSKVKVVWTADERKRVVTLTVLEEGPRSGTATGVITEVNKEAVTIKPADGLPERYVVRVVEGLPDREMMAKLGDRKVGDKVEIKWALQDRKRVVEIKLIEAASAPAANAKVSAAYNKMRELGAQVERAERELKQLRAADTGGATNEQVAAAEARLKDLVAKWQVARQEYQTLRDASTSNTGGEKRNQPPAQKSGDATGVVTEKGEGWFRIKFADGGTERYMPQWKGGQPAAGGGLDKDMLARIAALNVGDKVQVQWVWVERYRVVGLKVLSGDGSATPPGDAILPPLD